MIKITMRNNKTCRWKKKTYTDYTYDGKFFIVARNGQWVGFYNLDDVVEIVVKD